MSIVDRKVCYQSNLLKGEAIRTACVKKEDGENLISSCDSLTVFKPKFLNKHSGFFQKSSKIEKSLKLAPPKKRMSSYRYRYFRPRSVPFCMKKSSKKMNCRRKVSLSEELKAKRSLTGEVGSCLSSTHQFRDMIRDEINAYLAEMKLSEKFIKKSLLLNDQHSNSNVKRSMENGGSKKQQEVPKIVKKTTVTAPATNELNTANHSGDDNVSKPVPSLADIDTKITALHRILSNIQSLKDRELKLKEKELAWKEQQLKVPIVVETFCPPDEMFLKDDSKKPYKNNILLGDEPHDQEYYDWRQRKVNLLYYKKSQRTIDLNRKHIKKFLKAKIPIPVINNCSGLSRKCQKAYFITNKVELDDL